MGEFFEPLPEPREINWLEYRGKFIRVDSNGEIISYKKEKNLPPDADGLIMYVEDPDHMENPKIYD